MSNMILTNRSNLVAIADAIRETTGSSEPMTLTVMAQTIAEITPGGNIDPSSVTVGLGEDGKVYAYIDGQLVGIGVAVEDLKAPEDPEEPSGVPISLAAGIYSQGAIEKAMNGDTSARKMLIKSWADLVAEGSAEDIPDCRPKYDDELGWKWNYSGDLVLPDGAESLNFSYDANLWWDNDCTIFATVIPYGVTTLIEHCDALGTVVIMPNTVTEIREGAFDMDGTTTVYFCGTEEEWNAIDMWEYGNEDYVVHFNYYFPNSCHPDFRPEEPTKSTLKIQYIEPGEDVFPEYNYIDVEYTEGETWANVVDRYPEYLRVVEDLICINIPCQDYDIGSWLRYVDFSSGESLRDIAVSDVVTPVPVGVNEGYAFSWE